MIKYKKIVKIILIYLIKNNNNTNTKMRNYKKNKQMKD